MKKNFLAEFERAMTLDQFKKLLGEQLAVYELHYKKAEIKKFSNKIESLKILIITEPWCSDSTAIIPVIQKLFLKQNVEIRILLRDQHPELMDLFLTKGSRSIPLILILDRQGYFLMRFGPRPQEAQAIFDSYREDLKQGKIERAEVARKIRNFYARDKGLAILNQFIPALEKILEK